MTVEHHDQRPLDAPEPWRDHQASLWLDRHAIALAVLLSLILHGLAAALLAPRSEQHQTKTTTVEVVLGPQASKPLNPSSPPDPAVLAPRQIAAGETRLHAGRVLRPEQALSRPIVGSGVQPEVLNQVRASMPKPSAPLAAPERQPRRSPAAASEVVPSALAEQISAHLKRFQRYPRAARRSGMQGAVWLSFELDARGFARTPVVVKSSGHALLDQAALDLLERAQPLPPPPSRARLQVQVPIHYRLQAAAP